MGGLRCSYRHLQNRRRVAFALFEGFDCAHRGRRVEAADRRAALGATCIILYNAWRQIRPAILELGDIAPEAGMEARI